MSLIAAELQAARERCNAPRVIEIDVCSCGYVTGSDGPSPSRCPYDESPCERHTVELAPPTSTPQP